MKSATSTKSELPKSILIIGAPGSGKTTLATQLPKPYFINADNNINGPIKWLRENNKLKEFHFDDVLHASKTALLESKCEESELKDFPTEGDAPIPRRCRYRYMAGLLQKAVQNDDIETLVLDSLTSITEILLDEVRRQANLPMGNPFGTTTVDKPLRIQDWGAFASLIKNLLFELMGANKRLVVIGHIKVDKDEITGVLNEFINIPGQFSLQIASYFEEAWLLYSEEKMISGERKLVRMIKTEAGGAQTKLGLKSAAGLPALEPLELDTLIKKIS